MTPNFFTPTRLSNTTLQTVDAATSPRERIQAARDKLAQLRQQESTLRSLMTDREAKAAALRREHGDAEQAATEAAQALGRAEASAELGEVDAQAVRLARDDWAALRKVAEELRPRLDEALQHDAAAAMAHERLASLQPLMLDAIGDVRAGSSILFRAWVDEALAAYDAAAAQVVEALARVEALAGIAVTARRPDLFTLGAGRVALPELEAGRTPPLTEAQIAVIAREQKAAAALLMHEAGAELEPGAADPWAMAH